MSGKNNSELVLVNDKTMIVAKQMDEISNLAMNSFSKNGFEKAYIQSAAIQKISELLTEEYMSPIISLKNKKIGFLTDEKPNEPYKNSVIKDCVIEAVLNGLETTGNHFNIIGGKMYVTKEGFSHKLLNLEIEHEIVYKNIEIDNGIAKVETDIFYKTSNKAGKKRTIFFSIRVNTGMGTDAIFGKTERKAKAWIYRDFTGNNLGDGDVQDIKHEILESKNNISDNKNLKEDIKKEADGNTSNIEDAVLVEISKTDKICDDHLVKATSLENLELRYSQIKKKYPDYLTTITYDKLKTNFKK